MDDPKSGVMNRALEKLAELVVGFEDDQGAVAGQVAENLAGEGADAGAVFDNGFGGGPIDMGQHSADEKGRTGNERTNHPRVLEKIQGEDHRVARAAASRCAIDRAVHSTTLHGRAGYSMRTHENSIFSIFPYLNDPGNGVAASNAQEHGCCWKRCPLGKTL